MQDPEYDSETPGFKFLGCQK